ncbi:MULTISPECIES: hypothetical protein [unclassified Streptomyces]|uniref:hypothetical protein n=1 Tax=unclassified Streptomyces TaxID=2593676 RepID=UPI0028C4F1CF|nr:MULTISPECIES: hypothetical protein [unclassified Streptomyces]WNO75469.1 hypothetical protein RPQ07_29360 [Streptomyces sp. AM8-1-1]
MANPYTAPIPPTPRPPGTRPLHKRVVVWIGGSALLVAGALIGSTGDDGQKPVGAKVKPATTITATVTATPEPGPTVTETVRAKAKPAPAVTVTKTATARAADTGSNSSNSNSQDSTGTCTIVSNAGNCYSAGQFCRNSDHGAVTTNASGTKIKCTYSSNAWRWTYI